MSPSLQPLPYQAMHVEANVLHGEGPVYTKDREASSGKRYGTSVNMIQKRNMPSTTKTKTKIDGATFKIPANPEDEEDFIPDGSCVADTQKEYGLRERIGRSGSKKKTPATARPRLTKSPKPLVPKKTRAASIIKTRQKDDQEHKLIVNLSLCGKLLAKLVIKTKKSKKSLLKRVKTPKGFFTNKYRFKLRWTPFAEYPEVDQEVYQEVYNTLADSLSLDGISLDRKSKDAAVVGAPQGPMHAGDAVTVDALVKVIMSQATNNENALSAQARLIQAFPYVVDGKKVVGKIPNYHDVRTADSAKLKNALATAGLQNLRAKTIPECLNAIRQKNIEANSLGCNMDCNPPNASEFVPGSLSLDYLNELTPQEKLDELVSLPGIGVKTAACILAFNFQLPVFAVDTHVYRMVKWLGWIPEGANRNDGAAHLDFLIPDHLKYGLHQGFWHHGQKCIRCKAGNDENTEGWKEAVCVLEEFLKRQPRKERKSPDRKRKREEEENAEVDSPKPKLRKGNKTMTSKNMTVEEAEQDGYEPEEITINDNFDAPGGNVTGVKRVFWRKRVVHEDGTVETATARIVS